MTQQGEIKLFINFPDVVFAREHAMAVTMHHHPAMALEINLALLKLLHLSCELPQQLRAWRRISHGERAAEPGGYQPHGPSWLQLVE